MISIPQKKKKKKKKNKQKKQTNKQQTNKKTTRNQKPFLLKNRDLCDLK